MPEMRFIGESGRISVGFAGVEGKLLTFKLSKGEKIIGIYGESFEKEADFGRFRHLGLIISKS